jgi:hypothetical protein
MLKSIVCLTVESFNEWIELIKECGFKYKVVNESDYTGFQAKISWTE